MIRFIVALISLTSLSVQASHRSVVWNGFKHEWTYNHRCNRIGDFVVPYENHFLTAHASATGYGADETKFQSSYATVESKHLKFHSDRIDFDIQGLEGQPIHGTKEFRLPRSLFSADEKEKFSQFLVVLNGFDLISKSNADKLQRLKILASETIVTANEVIFKIEYEVILSCRSIECRIFDRRVHYELQIYFQVIAGDAANVIFAKNEIDKKHTWDRRHELVPYLEEGSVLGAARHDLENSFMAIRSFSIDLNRSEWLLSWAMNIQLDFYCAADGLACFTLDQHFKSWRRGMQKESASPKDSMFSFRHGGHANLNIEPILVQVSDAKVRNHSRTGTMFWRGRNQSPDQAASLNQETISY